MDKKVWLGEMLASGFTNMQARELFEAEADFKMSRVNFFDRHLPLVHAFCREFGLAYELSEYRIFEFMDEEGKGQFSNAGVRTADTAGLRFCYVHRDPEVALHGRDTERAEDYAPDDMGKLLRIPACCTAAYKKRKDEALTRYGDDFALITLRETGVDAPYDARMNYPAQYFNYSLYTYFPCSWECSSSLERSQGVLDVLNAVSPAWAQEHLRRLSSVIVYENMVAVHRVDGRYLSNSAIQFNPHDLESTSSTELGRRLRREGALEWDSSGRILADGQTIAETCETRVIPFRTIAGEVPGGH